MAVDERELERQAAERMFPGGGEMGARMRAHDWSTSALGPVSTWPRELRSFVGMVLANPFPMNLLWGPDLLQLYNDAYIPLMGGKHPSQLGRPCRETWAEIWPQVEPRFRRVLDSGISATHQQQQLFLHRHGFFEESYFTDSYAPLWGEGDRVAGVLVTVVENTQVLLAERRLRTLKDLATRAAGVDSLDEALGCIGDVLRQNPADVPFALLYLRENGAAAVRLALAIGVEAGGPASPMTLELAATQPWPLSAARADVPLRVDARALSPHLPGGPWPEPAHEALVIPLGSGEVLGPLGFVVLGASSRLLLDIPYQDFMRMLATQVDTLLANQRVRRRIEQEQLDAHARLAGILETVGDVFIALDSQWRILRVNSNLERMTGSRREDVLGRVLWEAWPFLKDPSLHYWTEYSRCMSERVPVRFFDHVKSLDLWLETRAHPTPDGGIAAFIHDVGEQKRAEAELDRVFALSRDLLCVGGFDGYFKRVNPAWQQTLGWSEAQLLSVPFMEFVHEEDREMTLRTLASLRESDEPLSVDIRMVHRDGSMRWLSWSVTPRPRQGLLFSVGRDVTESRRQVDDIKGRADFEQQLIGIVSHDLRNPLNAITLGAQALLRQETLGANSTRIAVRVLAAAERGTRMVCDLLDFTQARLGGGLPISPKPADLHLLARQVVEEARMSHPERDFQLLQTGDARGDWDGDRIVQLLTNLVTNAARYSPAGSTVTLLTLGVEGGVELEVHNIGAPISPDVLPRLFQPLQRGKGHGTTAARSVGLGLYIVKQIVHAHGGHIEVSSTPDAGTTFHVRLPRRVPTP